MLIDYRISLFPAGFPAAFSRRMEPIHHSGAALVRPYNDLRLHSGTAYLASYGFQAGKRRIISGLILFSGCKAMWLIRSHTVCFRHTKKIFRLAYNSIYFCKMQDIYKKA